MDATALLGTSPALTQLHGQNDEMPVLIGEVQILTVRIEVMGMIVAVLHGQAGLVGGTDIQDFNALLEIGCV